MGTSPDVVDVTGNTGIDNLPWVVGQGLGVSQFHDTEGVPWKVLVALHRRGNHGPVMANLAGAVRLLARRHDLLVVVPLQPNPAVSAVVVRAIGREARVRLIPPLGYFDFIATLADCDFAMTDSGGVQEGSRQACSDPAEHHRTT